jgi:uncharacterized membrane protein (DUF4010 family)
MPIDSQFERLAIALAIGLLFGLERGWSLREVPEGKRAAGLRTYGLSGLLGGISALVASTAGAIFLSFAFLTFGLITAAFQYLEARTEQGFSVTGTVAGLLAFLLGAYAVLGEMSVAIASAAAATAMLAFKQPLHAWLKMLTWPEIRAFVILVVMTALIAPILPDKAIDPWNAINPTEIWRFTILLAAVSFLGYFAIRIFGERAGLIVSALAGGLASSTAAALTFAKMARAHPDACWLLSGATLMSCAVMMARVIVVVGIANPSLLSLIMLPLAISGSVILIMGAIFILRAGKRNMERPQIAMTSPLELGTALKLAGLIAGVMLVSKLAAQFSGPAGVFGLSAISGLADVDAISLSLSQLSKGALDPQIAAIGIGLAVTANTLTKSLLGALTGSPKHGLIVGAGSAVALITAGGALFLMIG